MIDPAYPNLIEEGELVFTEFDEGGLVYFTAKEPIKVEWQIWKDEKNENEKHAVITFDFGMWYKCSVEPEHNFLIGPSSGISKDASFEEKVRAVVLFDVMHALDHCNFDPNYTHFHWAICGWLGDRLEKHEREWDIDENK